MSAPRPGSVPEEHGAAARSIDDLVPVVSDSKTPEEGAMP